VTVETHGDGTLDAPAGSVLVAGGPLPEDARLALVASRFHSRITQALIDGAVATAGERGIAPGAVDVIPVPGSFELGPASKAAAASGRYAAVAALGCVIRGETDHYLYVCSEASRGILLAALETGVPVGFGLLTCDTAEQAWARAGGEAGNKGADAVEAALDLASTLAVLRAAA
jgi:6,7-dimethyl-8-ribityllumazine synthase